MCKYLGLIARCPLHTLPNNYTGKFNKSHNSNSVYSSAGKVLFTWCNELDKFRIIDIVRLANLKH